MAGPDVSPEEELPEEDDVFNVDTYGEKDKGPAPEEPLYRVYRGSRIAISKAVGTMWKKRYDAALAAYELTYLAWDETFRYYNNNQTRTATTSRGVFKRGDSTENIVYSNLNVMLPAVYSKDPDIAVNTTDDADDDFVSVMKSLLNVLFKSKHILNAKIKIKRAVGLALLTNFGILKLDWTKKDDSREHAIQQMKDLTDKLVQCQDSVEAAQVYGQIEALENTLEVYKPSGPSLGTVLPHNLIIDPEGEDAEGADATWMIERIFFNTEALVAQYTQPCEGKDGENEDLGRVLVYKPTHKAAFTSNEGKRDDGLGMVMTALSADVTEHENQERAAFRSMYYSECYLVWDKITRRVMLFHRDDWVWPIWVWNDPLNITRFFPYFIIGFGMSTGGTVTVGETAYYLDQQDEINDINRQVARIRRTVFDYFFYNSDAVDSEEVEKFVNAIRGETVVRKNLLGVKAGERKLSEVVEAFVPPSFGHDFAALFDKEPILNTINRISNTSDALRGTQFKTNTNEAAVQSYQDSARMAVGAKIDVVEDTISDMAGALAELCVQNYDQEAVRGLVGNVQAAKWKQMDIEQFTANYNFECVAGTTEKPNSIFKKKEAVQIAQSIGQFASAAPITSMTIMLKVLEQAFSEIEIKPEDWAMLKQEALANLNKGNSQPGVQGAPGPGSGTPPPAGSPSVPAPQEEPQGRTVEQALMNLPPEVKQQVVQMHQQGKSEQEILQFMLSKLPKGGGQAPGAPPTPSAPAPQQQVAQ